MPVWFICELPYRIRNWTLGDNAHIRFFRQTEEKIDRFLIGDIDGGLQRVKRSTFDGVPGIVPIPTVSNESRLARVPCLL